MSGRQRPALLVPAGAAKVHPWPPNLSEHRLLLPWPGSVGKEARRGRGRELCFLRAFSSSQTCSSLEGSARGLGPPYHIGDGQSTPTSMTPSLRVGSPSGKAVPGNPDPAWSLQDLGESVVPASTPLRHQCPDCIMASKFPDSCHPQIFKKSLFKWCRLHAPPLPTHPSYLITASVRVCACVGGEVRERRGWGGAEGLLNQKEKPLRKTLC